VSPDVVVALAGLAGLAGGITGGCLVFAVYLLGKRRASRRSTDK
jgi:hypothetical protein